MSIVVARSVTVLCAVASTAALMVATLAPASADIPHIDPAALPRGENPGVVHMVRDTIRDGDRRVPATRQGRHEALWVVTGGYVVRDYNVGSRRVTRIVFVNRTGGRREIARSRGWIDVAVSVGGNRLAFTRPTSQGGQRILVSVEVPRSGRVLAQREFRLASLVAVTEHRVLLARRLKWHDPATEWWSIGPNRVWRLHDQAATGADVEQDKVMFDRPSAGEFCNRVAVLSDPERTLWRSCRRYPHQWSPNGRRVMATHTYFDAAGTDRWWVLDGRTGAREAVVTGRLDWDAVWEDNQHFLTLAQSDDGRAAVIRCDRSGACERASRIWDVPLPSEPSLFYASPPVVLADR